MQIDLTVTPPAVQQVDLQVTLPAPQEVSVEYSPSVSRLVDLLDVGTSTLQVGHGLFWDGTKFGNNRSYTAPQIDALISGATGGGLVVRENKGATTIYAGMAVAVDSTGGGVVRASHSDPDLRAIGVASTTASPGEECSVVSLGPCEVENWTASTGGAWLTPNTRLWLGPDGTLVSAPTTEAGNFQQLVGSTVEPLKIIVNPSRVTRLT